MMPDAGKGKKEVWRHEELQALLGRTVLGAVVSGSQLWPLEQMNYSSIIMAELIRDETEQNLILPSGLGQTWTPHPISAWKAEKVPFLPLGREPGCPGLPLPPTLPSPIISSASLPFLPCSRSFLALLEVKKPKPYVVVMAWAG